MHSPTVKRSLILFGLLAALVALVILVNAIGQIQLDPAIRVRETLQPHATESSRNQGSLDLFPFAMLLAVLTALFLPVYIYLLWRYPQLRPRRALHLLFVLFLLAAALVLTPNAGTIYPDQAASVDAPVTIQREEATEPAPSVPDVVPNELLVNLVGLMIALAVIVTLWLAGVAWMLSRRRKPEAVPEFIIPARAALDEIRAGGDLKNAILRCYYQMQNIASEKNSLQRQAGMTPREFARQLEDAGLPGHEVQRLTRLFEDVRYGNKSFSPTEESEAEQCLASVVEALEGGL
ncbi:MAG TPA: DUF4129 domain-containing protein [Anaerolineales bacterium]|nr:DUF4129 domain-containing protein [Anaerolineales bacterium]